MSPNTGYKNAAAFRTALEARLRQNAAAKGETRLVQQRKFMVFDRLLARLLVVAPDRWVLKGAIALGFRLHDQARGTMDLDIAHRDNEDAATDDLLAAQAIDLGDYFSFQIERAAMPGDPAEGTGRFRVRVDLDGRRFEQVTLDIGFANAFDPTVDILSGPDFFTFAGIQPVAVPVLPLERHVAEKLHAYTRAYSGRPSSRVKDLVDLILISSNSSLDADRLRHAIDDTFASRATHDVPSALPLPPDGWATPYRTLAAETGVDPDIQAGYTAARAFLEPVLSRVVLEGARWDPGASAWRPSAESEPRS